MARLCSNFVINNIIILIFMYKNTVVLIESIVFLNLISIQFFLL